MVRRTVLIEVKTTGKDRLKDIDNNINSLNRNSQIATRTLGNLSGVASAVITSLALRRVAQYADAWVNINNRLRQVTTDTNDLRDATEDLFLIAQKSRTGLQAVSQLYFRLSKSAEELGINEKQTLAITESLANQLTAAGLTAQEVNSVLLQTSQSFQNGVVNGDEFRSLSEAMPGILRSVAKELGVERSELRKLSEQGKITSQVLANSLIATLEDSRKVLSESQVSLSQTATLLSNSLTRLIGNLDQSLGGTQAVADGAQFLMDQLDALNSLVGTGFIGDLMAGQFRGLNRDIEDTVRLLGLTQQGIEASGLSVAEFLGGAFADLIPNIRQMIQILTVEFAAFIDKTASSFSFVFNSIAEGNFGALFEPSGIIEGIEQTKNQVIDGINKQREADDAANEAILANIRARIDAFRKEREARLEALGGTVDKSAPNNEGQLNDRQGAFLDKLSNELASRETLIRRSISLEAQVRNQGITQIEATEIQNQIRQINRLRDQEAQALAILGQANFDKLNITRQFTDLEEQIIIQSQARIAAARDASNRAQLQSGLQVFASLQQLNQKSLGLQRIAIVANTASAVIQSFNNAGGYPFGIIPASIMAAIGTKQLSQVGKSSLSSSGAGAASPGITQPTLTQNPFITTESSLATDILNELRNRDPNELFTNEQMRQIVSSITSLSSSGII